ncbi:M24 family metallopeptidase [Chromobacterium phragmitis]|uniref:Aminopeptidase P family protein n=1 Tax=Chromobacterium phragmitis TaxID=2202141 RepID=A0A344UDC6_9NEIS|nr:Xaa-Pro peptidase family protein [Chromobacterium phragmitis]AXE33274.1 aminopeptidase P family protein [Chromobacterium phragmitis]
MAYFEQPRHQEMARRDHLLRSRLLEAGIRQYVASGTESIYYLSGISYEPLERPFFLLLDAATGKRKMLVPQLEHAHLKQAWGVAEGDVHSYREYPAPAGERWEDALIPLLSDRFAFDPATPLHHAEFMQSVGGQADDSLDRIRMVKSSWEIAKLARAGRYAAEGVNQLLRGVYDGVSVAEGYAIGQQLLRRIIRDEPDFDPLCTRVLLAPWPAPLSAQPHAIPQLSQRLKAGPHVVISVVRLDGYTTECERTFFTRPPSPSQRERFQLMSEARRVAMAMLRPGVACAEIDEKVNAFLCDQRFGDWHLRLHRCGHGLGLGNHEAPWLAQGSDDVLQAGMVVSIEPGIYLAEEGGYRHSDTLAITADGWTNLTQQAAVDLNALTIAAAKPAQRMKGYFIRKMVSA